MYKIGVILLLWGITIRLSEINTFVLILTAIAIFLGFMIGLTGAIRDWVKEDK